MLNMFVGKRVPKLKSVKNVKVVVENEEDNHA
jgi:hypothetical protein